VLGIDAALRTTGYGIVDSDGRRFVVADCGVVTTSRQEPLSECLRRLAGGMRELVEQYAPDVAAIEGGFYFQNARTAMALGAARGAVIATLADMRLPIYEYAPRRVKQAVCGYGNASKQQVKLLVCNILNMAAGALHDDATDGLALAICHAQTALAARGLLLPPPL
jgi:crossover junction endodeoxyribonuclease RuvC